ncbi:hypothetical protein CHUAL_001349 [Chamberlinius hualienensis]
MVDYIRGKKTYTKWDTDTDNVDIEYLDGSLKANSNEGWLSGTKGRIIKILFVLLLFSFGLIIGYFIKRSVQEKPPPKYEWIPDEFAFNSLQVSTLQNFIQPSSIKEFLRNVCVQPHVAGTLSGDESASIVQRHWESLGISDVRVDKYNVLLSYPSNYLPNDVLVVSNKTSKIEILLNITNAMSKSEIKPFLAYSPSGQAEGRLVFANYGRQEDFLLLRKLNVSVQGNIALIKFGEGHHGDKVRWAAECGAAGVLLYPDPAEYVGKNEVFPQGIGLPEDAVIYGSLKTFPGDPMTPRMPSIDSAFRPRVENVVGLPTIPAQQLSYKQAEQLLLLMGGVEPPENWVGGLNSSYRLGPDFLDDTITSVSLKVHNELVRKDIFNVIGVIHGNPDNSDYVIVGAHHDTWTTGASDPASGLAILMEIVKAFGLLQQTGWRPHRSIVFASWDAEEFGIVGSLEWVEDHFKELMDNCVAYINVDSAVTGNTTLHALGSPLLQRTLLEAAKWVESVDGSGDTAYDQLNRYYINSSQQHPSVGVFGTGSDFVSFMTGYGIPAMHIQYADGDTESEYPLYHTEYDTFDVIANHVDSSFHASTNLARLLATMVLSLSDFLVLPFSCDDYVVAMERGLDDLKRNYGQTLKEINIYLDVLERAIQHFNRAAVLHSKHFNESSDKRLSAIRQYNRQLMQVERTFILSRGVRESPVFRHAIFGPHPHDLHSGVTFPGVVDSILKLHGGWLSANLSSVPETKDIEAVKDEIAQVVNVIRAAGNLLINSVVTHLTSYSFL